MHRKIQNYTEKNVLIKIFDFYVFSNMHVALVGFFLVKITLIEMGISENKTAWFVFFATLLSYTIIRFLRLNDINNWYNKWIKKNSKLLYSISILSFIAVLYFGFQLRLKAILTLIPFSLATLFYVFPLEKYSLRNIAGLKLFLIAFSWAGITVLFPIIQNYILPRMVDYITFFQRFLFVIAITLPFDIRDLDYDLDSLKTLPQQFGIKKTKHIGFILLALFFILEFLKPIDTHTIWTTLSIAVFSGILLNFATNKQSKYYSAFLVEALPIFWVLLIILNR